MTGYVNAQQAASLLGVSVRTLDRYVSRGLITPTRTPGGHRRFASADVTALLTEGQVRLSWNRPAPEDWLETWVDEATEEPPP
jgi:excisionase family DNA binding protein